MKKFIYTVAGFEFTDNTAFGTAWKVAKIKAVEKNAAIYREVITDTKVQNEVYVNAGYFESIDYATEKEIKIWS